MSDDRSVSGKADDRPTTMPQLGRRGIRSYVLRQGRMTNGQRRAMDELLVPHGIDDLATMKGAFQVDQPLTLEIGFGMGDSLLEMASALPERNFVGVEVHAPGVGHLLSGIEKAAMDNLKVIHGDVTTVLCDAPARTFSEVLIFFPDPWHKKKHQKRRLINSDFVAELLPLMDDQALLHVATDWEPYAETIFETMADFPEFSRCEPPWRPETKYECRGVRLGHLVTDLCYRRVGFDDGVAD